ncbi:hypothetical protein [Paraburkholderia bannensis]|uniref:hypothetical protein n=1 Tax=Paraburkholderia bannensis TaxID=765414 RepID=UPI002AC3374D|nr:hypothetical protein [Paraburkholderia bannensis]
MTWNTLDVPLENGWQCTLIPGPQYYDLTAWGRGYHTMSARRLYPNAGRDHSAYSWNTRPLSNVDKGELWEKDRLRQLADDQATFARHFRPNWDTRTITGGRNLDNVRAFVRDSLNLAHWKLPTDNDGVKKLLCDAVASGQLVPVANREYRGVPHVAPPAYTPHHRAATFGGDSAYPSKVMSYPDFVALQRANGELPTLTSFSEGTDATLDPLPGLGAPATGDDGFGLAGIVEAAANALLGGGDNSGDRGETDLFDGDSGDDSSSLGDAQPFAYQPDMPDDDEEQVAARGVRMTGNEPGGFAINPNGQDVDYFDSDGNLSAQYHGSHGEPHGHNFSDGVRDNTHLPMSPINFD